MSQQQHAIVAVSGDELAIPGLAADVAERCQRAGLVRADAEWVVHLGTEYGVSQGAIVGYVEEGIGLPSIAESLRLQQEHTNLKKSSVPTISSALEKLGFREEKLPELAPIDQKILFHGQALSARQVERAQLDEILSDSTRAESAAPTITYAPQATMLEVLVELAGELYLDDGVDPLALILDRIEDGLGGDLTQAYQMAQDTPRTFLRFLRGDINALELRQGMLDALATTEEQTDEEDATALTSLGLPDTGDVIERHMQIIGDDPVDLDDAEMDEEYEDDY